MKILIIHIQENGINLDHYSLKKKLKKENKIQALMKKTKLTYKIIKLKVLA